MKVDLETKPFAPGCALPLAGRSRPIAKCLPYFKPVYYQRKTYVHKIRSAYAHWDDYRNKISHFSFSFVCGNSSTSTKGELLYELREGDDMCKRCVAGSK